MTATAFADDAALLRCRELSDPAARLACYDAVALPASKTSAPRGERRETPDEFGIDRTGSEQRLDAIESHIEGRFDGWGPRDKIQLANGQVWQISDGSTGGIRRDNPKVRIRRGVLGAFYLEVEGTHQSPRVRRLK